MADSAAQRTLAMIADHVCSDRCQIEPVVDYYCPTERRYVGCPGPCPDGREHVPTTRERVVHRV